MISGTIQTNQPLQPVRQQLKNNGLSDEQTLIANELLAGCLVTTANVQWTLRWEKTKYIFEINTSYTNQELTDQLLEGLKKETSTQLIFGKTQTTAIFKI